MGNAVGAGGLPGVTVTNTPTTGQTLVAQSTSTAEWVTGGGGPPTGAAGGDLGSAYPNPTVTATHLAAALPVAQGGTGNTSGTAVNISDTLDQVPTAAANVSVGGNKITSLANGTAGTDAVAFGQLPSTGSPLPLAQGGTGLSESTAAALLAALGALALAGGTLTGALRSADVPLSQSGGLVALNSAAGNVFPLTLTASGWTISNPTNPPGTGIDQVIRVPITQGGSGGFTVSWDTAYDFGAAGQPALSAAAGAVDIIAFEWRFAISKWCYLGSALGN